MLDLVAQGEFTPEALPPTSTEARDEVSVIASNMLDSENAAIFKRSSPSRTFILSVVKSQRISGRMS